MSTDPKKNDELKDEELEKVSGGTGGDSVDEDTLDDGRPISTPGKGGREKS